MPRHRRFSKEKEEDTGHKFEWFGNNRLLCDVLDDMRKCNDSMNFSPMKGLIEEAQIMGTRMEAALSDQRDLKELNSALSKARKAYKALEQEYKVLEIKKQDKK